MSDNQFFGFWWFQVLIISKCMHGLSTSMLLLLHSAFMLRVANMLLKEEVRCNVLNSHGHYIADHGKSWKNHGIVFLNFCGNPGLGHLTKMAATPIYGKTKFVPLLAVVDFDLF